jgi:glycoprotein endo-alpha-1,2-mannosidase
MARTTARRLALATALVGAALVLAAPVSAARLTIGAYYYTWYGKQSGNWSLGYARGALDPSQAPFLGEYSSSDPGVIATQYSWAHKYGVDVFMCAWVGPGGADLTIRDGLMSSPARGTTRIAIFYESIDRLGLSAPNQITIDDRAIATMTSDFDYLARTYFTDPAYYRIGGRPVVVLYVSRIYTGKVAKAIQTIRARIRLVTGRNPYLIGDEVDPDIGPFASHIRLFDAITGYTLYSRKQKPGWPSRTDFLAKASRRMQTFSKLARRLEVRFVPGTLPGFNDRAVRPAENHHVLPHELGPNNLDPSSLFRASLRTAGVLVDPKLNLLTVTSWNEWNEDTQIEPTAPGIATTLPVQLTQNYLQRSYGFGLLQALADFRSSWRAPTPAPKKRSACVPIRGGLTPLLGTDGLPPPLRVRLAGAC